jgi:hypothetical protein
MRQLPLLFALGVLPALTFTSGCSKKEVETSDDLPKGKFSTGPSKSAKTAGRGDPLKAPLDGVIRGRVVFVGDKPKMAIIEKMATHNDHAGCLAGTDIEKREQKWITGEGDGVANVVISLKPPAGKYFELREEDKKRTDKVTIDQPHCAFVPHITAAYPVYWNGKEEVPSGQVFVVRNSAPFNHNTNWKGDPTKTAQGNVTLKSKEEMPLKLVPESKPIQLSCDIHPWMYARVWAFDHPYFAVTQSDGKFEIKNVPTGVELGVVAWHEVPEYFNGGKDGTKQKFNPGDNTVDLKISAK